MSAQTFWATRSLSPVMTFTCDVEAPEAIECLAGVGLRTIDEREEAREVQIVLVVGRHGRAAVCGARGDGDHAAAGGELAIEHRLGFLRDPGAAGEHRLRSALDDRSAAHRRRLRRAPTPGAADSRMEVRQGAERLRRRQRRAPGRLPERLVELVAADHTPVGERRIVAQQPGAQHCFRRPAVGVQSAART